MAFRPLTPEEASFARENGKEVYETSVVDDKGNVYPSREEAALLTGDTDERQNYDAGRYGEKLVGRQFVSSAVPIMAGYGGGLLGGAATGAAFGAAAGPIGIGAGALIGGLAAGFGAKAIQDKALQKYSEANPDSGVANFFWQSQEDVRRHPVSSALATLPASIFGGGTLRPVLSNLTKAPGRAAVMGGIQGGLDAATQYAATGEINPLQSLAMGAGGSLFGGRLSSAVPTSGGGTQARPITVPLNKRQSWNPEALMGATPEQLLAIPKTAGNVGDAKFYGALAKLKQNNVPITEDMLIELAETGPNVGYEKILTKILGEQLPTKVAQAAQEAKAAELINQAKVETNLGRKDVTPLTERVTKVRPAPEGPDPFYVEQPPSTGEAKASAEAILGAETSSDVKALAALKKEEKAFQELMKNAETIQDTELRQMALNGLAQRRSELDARQAALFGRRAGAPEQPTGVTLEEVKNPREQIIIEEADGTQPEIPPNEPPKTTPPPSETTPPPAEATQVKPKVAPATGGDKGESVPVAADVPAGGKLAQEELVRQATIRRGSAPEVSDELGNLSTYAEMKGGTYDDLRVLVSKWKGWTEFKKLNEGLPARDLYRTFVHRLPDADKKELSRLWKAGAEDVPKSKADIQAEEVRKKTRIKAALEGNQPGKVGTPIAPPEATVATSAIKETPKAPVTAEAPAQATSALPEATVPAKLKRAPKKGSLKDITVDKEGKPVKGLKVKAAQKKAAKERRAEGSILSPFRDVAEGAGTEIPGPLKFAPAKGETPKRPSVIVDPVSKAKVFVRSTVDRIAEKGPVGKYFARKIEEMAIGRRAAEEPLQQRNIDAAKGTTPEQRQLITRWLYDMNDFGKSDIVLPENLQERANAYRAIIDEIGADKSGPDAPLVQDFDEKGKPTTRRFEAKQYYTPMSPSKEVVKILKDSNHPRHEELKQDYIKWAMDKTKATPEDAEQMFLHHMNPAIGPTAPNPRFRGLRYAEGIGLPPSWRDMDISRVLKRYINRHATDMTWHRTMESDPAIAKSLNLKENGRGEAIPDIARTPEGVEVKQGELLSDENVKAALADYVASVDPESMRFEAFQSVIHAGRIGPISQIRNIIQNTGALGEILSPSEHKVIASALKEAIFSDAAYRRALKSGSVRATRNILPTLAQDTDEFLAKAADAISKYSGAERIAKVNDVFLDIVGRTIGKARLDAGDVKFLDEFAPGNWKELKGTDDQKIIDFIAAKFTRNFSGAYDATGLPPALLRSSNAPYAPLFKLSRWSVERFNRWERNAYKEAKKGNIKPLLRSLVGGMLGTGVINILQETLMNRKPKELTWEEYLKLGDKVSAKETAYTLFSKAATASYGGILTDIIFAGVQLANREAPRTFNNLAFQAVSDSLSRLGQFASAVSTGAANIEDLPLLAITVAKDQLQVLQMLDAPKDVGNREERIARRMGYMPARRFSTPDLPDPFSKAEAYRRGETARLSRMFQEDLSQGKWPEKPDSAVRTSYTTGPEGYRDYYTFIRDAQGEKAAQAARERDLKETAKRYKVYSSALAR